MYGDDRNHALPVVSYGVKIEWHNDNDDKHGYMCVQCIMLLCTFYVAVIVVGIKHWALTAVVGVASRG